MAQEYNNEQIVKMFGKQMEKIGEKRSEMLKATLEQKATLQRQMEQFREQNKSLQQQLDQSIESLEDRFTDTANAVEFDAERLEKSYLGTKSLSASKKDIPCFSERSNIAACFTDNKKQPLVCDPFIEALTECANKVITAK